MSFDEQPNADPHGECAAGLAAAFAELANGNTLAAEDAFEREYEAQQRAAEEARHTMAEAARNVANLALLRDVTKAVAFYRKALDKEPEHAETCRLLCDALIMVDSIELAMQRLESDRMTLALRLYGESRDTFSPETAAVMDRMRPKIEALLHGKTT